jgi:predicted deacylase
MPVRTKPEPEAKAKPKRAAFEIAGKTIAPGTRATVELPISMLSDHTPISLTVHVVHGRLDGPTLFVSAAIHGDEIIGVEIIRRLLRTPALKRMRGTLICVPIVNVFGFITHDRYLPDRRDLNRSFPGSKRGSMASQLAHLFTTEIIARSDWGIDLHSASNHRTNLPQIRLAHSKPETEALALAFGAPVILRSGLRDGSLRKIAKDHDVDVLVFEAGEALRIDEFPVRVGVKGILRAMNHLGMVTGRSSQNSGIKSVISKTSYWVRSPEAGILRSSKKLGEAVEADELIGMVSDPLGENEFEVRATYPGIVVGLANLPVVNEGDALFHLAAVSSAPRAEDGIGKMEGELTEDPLFDEDEII